MPGGPIAPYSVKPVTAARAFPYFYDNEEMHGVEASVGADTTWELYFEMPPSLPSGTGKVRVRARANATSGSAKVNIKWVSVNIGENPNSMAVIAEGVQTLTWGAGDDGDYKELEVTLDADALVASEIVRMQVVFETSGWTLAQISGWLFSIIWE
jgi:hypothetical protein